MDRLVGLGTALLLVAHTAYANTAKDAEKLFAEGQRLIDANKIDAACEKFSESLSLEPALGTRLNLADCRERQSRFVDAYQLYVIVADEAAKSGKQSQLLFAKKRIDALSPKVVRVKLRIVEAALGGLAVKLGGRDVLPAEWSRPIIVAPGPFSVDASAPGREPFHADKDAAAGTELAVEIPALAVSATGASITATTTAPAARPQRSRIPWIVGGAGAGSLVLSGILGLHAKSRWNTAIAKVSPDGDADIEGAQTEADVATVFALVGTVAVGVGVYLYIREGKTAVVPYTDGRGMGASVVGSW